MTYFANPVGDAVVDAMIAGRLGFIATPAQGNRRPPGVRWCADNGCFGAGYPGDAGFLAWLAAQPGRELCAFAVAPDVVADAAATRARSAPFLPVIRELGYPVAFVAQDGLERVGAPWDDFDVLFIGGSTDWKLGAAAREAVAAARERGKAVHMGRVNSRRRLRYAAAIGCDSVDGTLLVYGPDVHLPRLTAWLREIEHEIPLIGVPA
jgi:hypothetical protein